MPEGYLDRPEVQPESAFVWDAFWSLSSDRPTGMSTGPIPFSAVDRFAQRYGIDDLDEFDGFRSIIRAIDAEYLRLKAAPSDEPKPASKKAKPV